MLIDAHTHLDQYRAGLEDALQEIARHRILSISTSMDVKGYLKTQAISRGQRLILPCFGIHPWYAHRFAHRLDELAPHIRTSPLLGEIGLDFHFIQNQELYPHQERVLRYFLQAAADQNKIINLHTKGAETRVLELLEEYPVPAQIVHWYSGPLELIDSWLERGSYFTVGAAVLRSTHIQKIALRIPLDRLLSETDNPGGWKSLTKKPGMPSLLLRVIKKIAEIRTIPPERMRRQIEANFLALAQKSAGLQRFTAALWGP